MSVGNYINLKYHSKWKSFKPSPVECKLPPASQPAIRSVVVGKSTNGFQMGPTTCGPLTQIHGNQFLPLFAVVCFSLKLISPTNGNRSIASHTAPASQPREARDWASSSSSDLCKYSYYPFCWRPRAAAGAVLVVRPSIRPFLRLLEKCKIIFAL